MQSVRYVGECPFNYSIGLQKCVWRPMVVHTHWQCWNLACGQNQLAKVVDPKLYNLLYIVNTWMTKFVVKMFYWFGMSFQRRFSIVLPTSACIQKIQTIPIKNKKGFIYRRTVKKKMEQLLAKLIYLLNGSFCDPNILLMISSVDTNQSYIQSKNGKVGPSLSFSCIGISECWQPVWTWTV